MHWCQTDPEVKTWFYQVETSQFWIKLPVNTPLLMSPVQNTLLFFPKKLNSNSIPVKITLTKSHKLFPLLTSPCARGICDPGAGYNSLWLKATKNFPHKNWTATDCTFQENKGHIRLSPSPGNSVWKAAFVKSDSPGSLHWSCLQFSCHDARAACCNLLRAAGAAPRVTY